MTAPYPGLGSVLALPYQIKLSEFYPGSSAAMASFSITLIVHQKGQSAYLEYSQVGFHQFYLLEMRAKEAID
jgi:hypothetical protein